MPQQENKKSHITDSQKNCLIEYLKKNTDLQSGKFTNQFTYKDAQRKWMEIGAILNSMPGAAKDWKSWSKTWQDLKSRTKSKVSAKKRHARGTGGGPPIEEDLSKIEEDIVDIVKVVSIEGHNETAESVVDFNFENYQSNNHDDEDQQDKILIVEEQPLTENVEEMITESSKKRIPKKKKSSTLRHTVDAVNDFKVGMEEKNSIKRKYFREKIEILKRIAIAKEKKVIACERQADAEERDASANERIAAALETIAESIL